MNEEEIVNPIVIHTHLLQKFMRHGKDYANLLALYSFYLYEAKKQETNQPLVTDEFTRKGMNWALDRVKKTKRILKEMKVIGMIQKQKYSYVRLFFIYTKKKICEILGKIEENSKEEVLSEVKKEVKKELKKQEKSLFEKTLIAEKIPQKRIDEIRKNILSIKTLPTYRFNTQVLASWIVYCEKSHIKYNTKHIENWLKKLDKRTSIEQKKAIYYAINKQWKDFYLIEVKNSKYHHFLGKSLMIEKYYKNLLDLKKHKEMFVYVFENIRFLSKYSPDILFEKYS
ncbi:hypothetical protein MNB_SV-13-1144 [hydrothermal vent metagenome]|uniref:Uncharacterized protein n=1 Tax=hydrothermal vent metagenome TaxID=652676 RepID=A0A1W1CL78_9ZZZZ